VLIALMERFSYPSLAAAREESAEILELMAIVSLGTPAKGGEQ